MSSSIRVPARLQPILMGALVLSLAATAGAAYGATYNVYDDAGLAPLLAHDWSNPSVGLQPGDEVIVHGGTYSALMDISAQGTAAAPIRIHAAPGADPSDPTNPNTAIIQNSVVFDAANYVTVDGLRITGCPTYDGVAFVNGAGSNTITNSDVSYCHQGIAPFPGSSSNVISNNVVHDNPHEGIILNETANGTHVYGNTVHHNGYDGIAINGDNSIVENNIVYTNGQAHIGTSGIRVFAGYPPAITPPGVPPGPTGYGQNNVIRYNIVYGNSDHGYPIDGNGIELDVYAKNNQVYFNVVQGNDGDGIILFGAESNWVFNNTVFNNGQSTLHVARDFELTGNTAYSSGTYSGVSINNIIANNLIASRTGIPSIAVEINSVSNTLGNQLIVPDSSNAIDNVVEDYGGNVLTTYTSLSAWNTAKGQTPDVASDPLFLNASAVTPTVNPGKNLSLASTSSPAFQTGASPLTLPTPITVTVDLWQELNNPGTPNINPYQPPIGAYTVDP